MMSAPNMRTEIWNICQRFGGEYEFVASKNQAICKLRDGTLAYNIESGVLEGEFGNISFSMTDISDVKHVDDGVAFDDTRGSRIGLLFDRAVSIEDRTPARLKAVVMSHPDPFWPGIKGAWVDIEL